MGYADSVMEFERALVSFAHPDDAEFTAGGTIAVWTRAGTEVHYVCATDGSAGWNGPDKNREEIARIREAEMRDAADVLGVSSVTFLGYTDGSLAATLELRRAITREVRRIRPDAIMTTDPSQLWVGRNYLNHPDHRAVGQATMDVIACDAPTRPQFPELLDEGLEPHEVSALWLPTWEPEGHTRVDITETMETKLKALRCHSSQIENMGGEDIEGRIRKWATAMAEGADMEYAEAFRTFSLNED